MSDTRTTEILPTIVGFLFMAYGLMTQIMAFVFWVQYIKTDWIVTAILLDPILAEIKGLLWPFFI